MQFLSEFKLELFIILYEKYILNCHEFHLSIMTLNTIAILSRFGRQNQL